MTHVCQLAALFRKAAAKFTVISILVCAMMIPVRAADKSNRKSNVTATASATAKIHKRFEVRPESFSEPRDHGDESVPDISFQDCDATVRKLLKGCVFIIYEIQ